MEESKPPVGIVRQRGHMKPGKLPTPPDRIEWKRSSVVALPPPDPNDRWDTPHRRAITPMKPLRKWWQKLLSLLSGQGWE